MGYQKPILITGSHRSGSTWAARMLAVSEMVGYINEPFNIDIRIGTNSHPFEHWFQYICEENHSDIRSAIEDILGFKYPLRQNILKARTPREFAKIARDQMLFSYHRLNRSRPLIKDPIAVFSAEWFYTSFNTDILVMIRHPAAFCSSLKIRNWQFDFRHFSAQPLLMRDFLYSFDREIKAFSKSNRDIMGQAILLWNCIYSTVRTYQERHKEWLFVKHEDLSFAPVEQFRSIYEKLNLKFTRRSQQKIEESSGDHNAIEQVPGSELLRNSKENVLNWQRRLSAEEINRIREGTSDVSRFFYTDDEW
jgi:Sulfotransferase family